MITQVKLIEFAKRSVPPFKWAIAGAGLLALAAIVIGWKANLATLLLIAGVILITAMAFIALNWITKLKPGECTAMAVFFAWAMLVLLVLSLGLVLSSAALNQPWPIRSYVASLLRPQAETLSEVQVQPLTNWIQVAKAAQVAKSVSRGRPLPNAVLEARASFEKWWVEVPLSARKTLNHSNIFDALSLNARIYRVQEIEDTKKAASRKWVDEAIGFFEEVADSRYVAESYLEKAAVFIDMSDLRHTKPEAFSNLAEQGESTMKRAYELAANDQKSEVYRLWSRFYYNLARPRDGNLSENWDNNFLLISEARMREGFLLSSNELKNVTQLARVTQKAAANPPQDTSKEWTQRLWDVQRTLKATWANEKTIVTDARNRMAPLNILGVITMDAVLRSWLESTDQARGQLSRAWLAELDTTAFPAQRELLSLVIGTELEDAYDFDIYYDLARMHSVRLLVAESGNKSDPGSDFKAVEQNLASARKGATTTQLQAALDSIGKYPCFTNLSEARRESLLKILTLVQ